MQKKALWVYLKAFVRTSTGDCQRAEQICVPGRRTAMYRGVRGRICHCYDFSI